MMFMTEKCRTEDVTIPTKEAFTSILSRKKGLLFPSPAHYNHFYFVVWTIKAPADSRWLPPNPELRATRTRWPSTVMETQVPYRPPSSHFYHKRVHNNLVFYSSFGFKNYNLIYVIFYLVLLCLVLRSELDFTPEEQTQPTLPTFFKHTNSGNV